MLGLFSTESQGQSPSLVQDNLAQVLATIREKSSAGMSKAAAATAAEAPRIRFAPEGHVTHLAAPPGFSFEPQKAARGLPEDTARTFVRDNRMLLGIDVAPLLTRAVNQRSSVRLQQTYAGVPVFAGHIAVQLDESAAVEFLAADVSAEVNQLDAEPGWTKPTLSQQEATKVVFDQVARVVNAPFVTTTPQLMVFAPSVMEESGPVRLVWEMKVDSELNPEVNERWFIDAKTGAVARRYPLTHSAINRQIRDSVNTTAYPGNLVRVEGGAATGITEVDNAYRYLGHTYNFYLSNHGRDSFNGAGATIPATVRYCRSETDCPWSNAQWTGSRMRFGNGFAIDDVVGHEFTHAVTENTSGLVYANASGAINESLSDIFGEFIDLGNGFGDDSAGVRWDMGEDLPNGRIRSMDNPPARSDPDRRGSALYVPASNDPDSDNDFGGVHSNSGVNNKLCFLLTDGDTFNGRTVYGVGIARVADLYYEANANLLTSGSGWTDLYEALRQAAVNLSWNIDDRNNLYQACRAVEIAAADNRYVDRTQNCLIKTGLLQNCSGIVGGPYQTVNQGNSGMYPGDALHIHGGSYDESVVLRKIGIIRSYSGSAVIGN
jgi:Zn-dependent metalloprotease